ncbi:MAG: hypothetical protein C0592_05735 [Marinilabiliales bacterium]|nr:MAG: hypothetical protein C0592_05735 [Marinilabiliales bacterium]
MRWLLIISMILSVTLISCKCKEKVKDDNAVVVEQPAVSNGEFVGIVHHNFEESTCTVIEAVAGDEILYLIPVNGLPEELNVDGATIRFNYTALRMPQPEGCTKGIPVELRDVEEE